LATSMTVSSMASVDIDEQYRSAETNESNGGIPLSRVTGAARHVEH